MITRTHQRVAVIVAATEFAPAWQANLAGFQQEVSGHGELIVVVARTGPQITADRAVRVLTAAGARVVPELWTHGLEHTSADLVAFSTPSMRPARGWLSALLADLHATGASAVGGPIEPADGLICFDRAVYLQRYLNYAVPWPTVGALDPAGENVLYRRSSLMALRSLWADGFWEAAIHRELRLRRERVVMCPEAIVAFQGGQPAAALLGQRFEHARHYGTWRAREWNALERWLRVAMVPSIPALLLARIVRRLRSLQKPLAPWIGAFPELVRLLSVWAIGEAVGTAIGSAIGTRAVAAPSRSWRNQHASLERGLSQPH